MIPLLSLLLPPTGFRPVEARFLSGIPYVLADVGPETKAWFVLDTGYPHTAFNGALPAGWLGPRLRVEGGTVDFQAEADPEYRVKPGFGGGTKVVGSFGNSFLKGGQIVVDAYSGTVSLRLGGALTPAQAERALREGVPDGRGRLATISLKESADGYFTTPGRLAGKPIVWTFDTGSNRLFLMPKPLADAKGVDLEAHLMILPGAVGKTIQRLIPRIDIGPARLVAPVIGGDDDFNILGTSALASRLLIDLPGKAAYWLASPDGTAAVDAAIGQLARHEVRTAPDGRLLTELHGMRPRTVELVSVQDETVASLRELFGKAAAGDPKALSRVAELNRSYGHETRIMARDGDKTIRLDL